jgi:glycosyltransferase involved in cell wall biosynthesis
MSKPRPPIYIFGWPSFLGGADTKLAHLLRLLHREFSITVIPNDPPRLKEKVWTRALDQLGIRYTTLDRLPRRLKGVGLSLCNDRFFTEGIASRAKERGLRVIWSSEMMWHQDGELDAVKQGLLDKVLYTSEIQKKTLSEGYGDLPGHITGNYIDPASFPFVERRNRTFTIGRLSRPDSVKYPEDFPVFYECLELGDVRFRVMAWDADLRAKYSWHKFDGRWDLLESEAEAQVQFLHSLDLFVYPLGQRFVESWGRSTVEAMLTGAIPLVPPGHHLENLVEHGKSGYVCHDFVEYKDHAQRLSRDYAERRKMARQCREHAERRLCRAAEHLNIWKKALQ